ncbi:hypothetical protein BD779DRAFT_1478548 [Infundibulicybe gibba]|nr:hypothetical protein BD779DRAFT_1478548 [Infundibulicybe gibba]
MPETPPQGKSVSYFRDRADVHVQRILAPRKFAVRSSIFQWKSWEKYFYTVYRQANGDLFPHVCQSWREVALSTSLLWSRLPFLSEEEDWEEDSGLLRLLELHLENSTRTALGVGFKLSFSDPDGAPFLPLITPHLSRSQHLNIRHHHELPNHESNITHKHFPLLKSLELTCFCPPWASQDQLATTALGGIEFPWEQLTQLTIKIHSSAEALALLQDCGSLEVCHFVSNNYSGAETPPTLPKSKTVHSRLRTLIIEDSPFTAELLGNSSAKLNSFALRYIECSHQDLADISAAIPMVIELNLEGLDEESLRLLAASPDSSHGVLFPRLKRLVIRRPLASDSALRDIFYSRLYLAPNLNIIENTSPLQHAELHLQSVDCCGTPTYFGESHQNKHKLFRLVSRLQWIYSRTTRFDKEILGQAAEVIHHVNRDAFPEQGELGYCEVLFSQQADSPRAIVHAPPLPLPQQSFFQKLDAAFAALEGYQITHALDILRANSEIEEKRSRYVDAQVQLCSRDRFSSPPDIQVSYAGSQVAGVVAANTHLIVMYQLYNNRHSLTYNLDYEHRNTRTFVALCEAHHQQDRMVLDSLGVVGGTGGAGLAWASAENGAENVENCIWIDKIAIPLIACGMSNMFATKRGPENTGTYVARGRCVVTGGMGAKEPGNPVWRVLCEMRVGGGCVHEYGTWKDMDRRAPYKGNARAIREISAGTASHTVRPLNRGYPAIRAPTQRSTFDNNTRLCSTSDAMKNRPSFPNACPHCQMAPSCVNLPYQAKFGSARGHHAEERWRDKIAAMSGATMSKLNAASTNTDRMPALESDNNTTRTIGMQRSGCATWG